MIKGPGEGGFNYQKFDQIKPRDKLPGEIKKQSIFGAVKNKLKSLFSSPEKNPILRNEPRVSNEIKQQQVKILPNSPNRVSDEVNRLGARVLNSKSPKEESLIIKNPPQDLHSFLKPANKPGGTGLVRGHGAIRPAAMARQAAAAQNMPSVLASPSLKESILGSSVYRSDIHTRQAELLLQDASLPAGSLIITKSYSDPVGIPFVANIKIAPGTVTKSIIKIDESGPVPVFRVFGTDGRIKIGGGTGFTDLNACLTDLTRHELRQPAALRPALQMPALEPGPVALGALRPAVIARQPPAAIDPLEARASQLSQDLQGLRATFREMGVPDDQVDGMINNLSRTIAKFETDPRMEHRFRKNTVAFADLGVQFPFTFYLKKNPANGSLNINFTTPGVVVGARVGQGTYKIVKKSHSIDIPPRSSSQKPSVRTQEVVLIRAKKGEEQSVSEGFNLVRQLQAELGPDVQLPGVPAERRYIAKDGTERLELVQEFYNGDFAKAVDNGSLPVDMSSTAQQKQFDALDNMDVMISASETLAKFHQRGYVHRDVKAPNILVKLDSTQPKPQGFINDFDLTAKIGRSDITSNYVYWDPCSRIGLVTPNADVYGMVMTLGESYFPNFRGVMGTPTRIDNPYDTLSRLMEGKLSSQFRQLGIEGDPLCQSIYADLQNLRLNPSLSLDQINRITNAKLTALVSSGRLNADQARQIQKLQAELSALPSVWGVILHTVNASQAVYNEILSDSLIRSKLESPDLNQQAEGMRLVMDAMNRHGLPSMETLKANMMDIRNQMVSIRTV